MLRKRQCQIDAHGTQFCSVTPVCSLDQDGQEVCVGKTTPTARELEADGAAKRGVEEICVRVGEEGEICGL
jgi:hypothetical protein